MLEAKKEEYCQQRAKGKSQRQAYLEAFPNSRKWKPKTVDNKAYILEKESEILARLKELYADNEQKAGLSRKKLLDKLENIIATKGVRFNGKDVLKAIEIYINLCGYGEQKNENEEQAAAHRALMNAIMRAKNEDK